MQGMLEPEEVETPLGQAEVRQLFRASRIGTIAGSFVTEGKVTRGARVRVVREGTVIYETTIESLRRFSEDVREVARRLRVRHRADQLPGRPRGRHARDLRDTEGRARALCLIAAGDAAGTRGSARNWRARMSTPRMRRVDEAVRQVIGDAIAAGLKDPRIGFLTVTDVRTSPDLRHARVYVSVLGDGEPAATRARRHAGGAAQRPRLPPGRGSPPSCA